MPKELFILLAVHLLLTPLFSQTSRTGVKGIVLDATNNEPLIGAAVYIEGLENLGVITDFDGNYQLFDLDPGTYSITCSYVSYQKKIIGEVQIPAGQIVQLNIVMVPATQELETVVITSTFRKETVQSVLTLQKNNISISDGISKDIITRSPDKNTGEVLKRMSGTTLQDNKFAIIRGLSDRYNIALINNNVLPSTEPDKKSFSFDLFPSAMLDNLFIYKSAQPDFPGDFAGGIIQMNTRDVPDEDFITLSLGTGGNLQTASQPYMEYQGGSLDWLGLDDGTRALPEGFPDANTFKLGSEEERVAWSKLHQNNWGAENFDASPLDQSLQLSFGLNRELSGNRFGLIGGITYSGSRETVFTARNDYQADGSTLYQYEDTTYARNILWGAVLNLAYRIGNNNQIALRNSVSVNGRDLTTIRGGFNSNSDNFLALEYYEFLSNFLGSTMLSGSHAFSNSKLKINWTAGYNRIVRDQPDLRTSYYFTPSLDEPFFSVFAVNNITVEGNFKYYSFLQENSVNGTFDISYPYQIKGNSQVVKVGTMITRKDRAFDARLMGYVIDNGFFSLDGLPDEIRDQYGITAGGAFSYWYLPRNVLLSDDYINDSLFRIKDVTTLSDAYTAQQYNTAIYAMSDNKLGRKFRVIWGVRMENWRQFLQSYEKSSLALDDEINIDSRELDTIGLPFDLLPSVNFIYSLTDKINIRLSGSQTVARPEMREYAPTEYFDYTNNVYYFGRTNLRTTQIYNADIRFEYFLGNGQIISVSGFYKYFNDPIQMRRYVTGTFTTADPINEDYGTNIGAELELRKNFSFVAPTSNFFNNLTIYTNLAYIKSVMQVADTAYFGVSERPLAYQSPYVINGGISYLDLEKGYGVNILYNQIGRRITELGFVNYPDIYQNPRPLLDAQLSIPFHKQTGTIRINYSDIFAADDIFYQDIDQSGAFEEETDQLISRAIVGSKISISITYRL
ncbi:MAG: hypothetical protein ABR95_00500 [Sphingobacteriales bacterium BACL12 MAG-120813-bin55]|jgi:hypothetical protein|nr:MAG: hypothetical protein ABR94_12285 [Sphingobacteriales bacterium BACL12 MAG-120802-bin5]KRP11138.1 MAG: hypothetical protein ABR95_00500 [Sphingobacteriales bacterium BACL12 MAG-120813-bin55]